MATFVAVELEMEAHRTVAFVEADLGTATSALVSFAGVDHRIEARVEKASAAAGLETEEHLAVAFVEAAPGIEA